MQKQPSEELFKKGGMRNFPEFTRKHLWRNLLFFSVDLCNTGKVGLRTLGWDLKLGS